MIAHDREALLERLAGRRVVASISGGKDSAAMSLYLRELGIEHDRVFLDTGWEHEKTYEYLRGELARVIGPITEISSPHKMVSTILRKGMFPPRQHRFCTQELKVIPMQRHLAAMATRGEDAVNTVGIRAGESAARSRLTEWEWSEGFDCETWRPMISWTPEDVIAIHGRHGLRPNPLYLLGASRVGCWPCIYARKGEIKFLAETDPGRIALLSRLEARVTKHAEARRVVAGEPSGEVQATWFQDRLPTKVSCSTCRGQSFHGPVRGGIGQTDGDVGEGPRCPDCKGRGTRRLGKAWPISKVVEWSKTSRGGRQMELFAAPPSEQGCMRWGLCETDEQAPPA